jgi:hypothetical protein
VDAEHRAIQRLAGSRPMTLAHWVRPALQNARRGGPVRKVEKKLDAIRCAAVHRHPTGHTDQTLAEIASGYLQDTNS